MGQRFIDVVTDEVFFVTHVGRLVWLVSDAAAHVRLVSVADLRRQFFPQLALF